MEPVAGSSKDPAFAATPQSKVTPAATPPVRVTPVVITPSVQTIKTPPRIPTVKQIRQTTLDSFSTFSGAYRKITPKFEDHMYSAIATYIATDMLPLSEVENPGFIFLLGAALGPDFDVPTVQTVKGYLEKMAREQKVDMQAEIDSAGKVQLTTDCWTSKAGDSYVSGTCHYIDNNWEVQDRTLFTSSFLGRHTSENLTNALHTKAIEWQISTKIWSTSHDNAANITKAIKNSEVLGESNPCFAHTQHLCIMSLFSLKSVKQLIKRCKKLVGHFKHSTQARNELHKMQSELSVVEHELTQCCKTRWNSYFDMLERLYEQKDCIYMVLSKSEYSALDLNQSEWNKVRILAVILENCSHVLTRMCGQKYVTVSEVRPAVYSLLHSLQPVDSDDDFSKEIKAELAEQLAVRFTMYPSWLPPLKIKAPHKQKNSTNKKRRVDSSKVEELLDSSDDELSDDEDVLDLDDENISEVDEYDFNSELQDGRKKKKIKTIKEKELEIKVCQVASYFDPRYKNLNHEPKDYVRHKILAIVEREYNKQQALQSPEENSESKSVNAYEMLMSQALKSDVTTVSEIDRYDVEVSNLTHTCNPLQWWKLNEKRFPILAELAKWYLSIPATSAPSERVFSTAGNIVTNKRTCLKTENVDMLVSLYQNSKLRKEKQILKRKRNNNTTK